jgi:hypothetical protein
MTVTLKVATTSPHSVPGRAGVLQHLLREAVLDVGSLSRVEERRGGWVEQEQPAIARDVDAFDDGAAGDADEEPFNQTAAIPAAPTLMPNQP